MSVPLKVARPPTQMRAFFFSTMALCQCLELCQALGELLGQLPAGSAQLPSASTQLPSHTGHSLTASHAAPHTSSQHPLSHHRITAHNDTAVKPSSTPGKQLQSKPNQALPPVQATPPMQARPVQAPPPTPITTTSCGVCSGPLASLTAWYMWARPLLGWLLAEAIVRRTAASTRAVVKAARGGWPELHRGLRNRDTQVMCVLNCGNSVFGIRCAVCMLLMFAFTSLWLLQDCLEQGLTGAKLPNNMLVNFLEMFGPAHACSCMPATFVSSAHRHCCLHTAPDDMRIDSPALRGTCCYSTANAACYCHQYCFCMLLPAGCAKVLADLLPVPGCHAGGGTCEAWAHGWTSHLWLHRMHCGHERQGVCAALLANLSVPEALP